METVKTFCPACSCEWEVEVCINDDKQFKIVETTCPECETRQKFFVKKGTSVITYLYRNSDPEIIKEEK